jgi:hypothetical protein
MRCQKQAWLPEALSTEPGASLVARNPIFSLEYPIKPLHQWLPEYKCRFRWCIGEERKSTDSHYKIFGEFHGGSPRFNLRITQRKVMK